ncbi:MAG: 1-(5-phosphoribosyl)-5-[(5-phosphoribosylamino)methylideneamino]imidazole-4-carboxamide isomerase [Clostridia bacterium]|nr:1-(5-phosphoribosyl)-5-[(5-phosphoribosylamino)methylideneamino]imidazole-4-carboxamide isomerase [Clostridia bacterium]
MIIYPAIDLLGGRCVRLRQGDYEDATRYSDDPLAVAAGFREAGAEWIHIVDLDAARTGLPVNRPVILRIAAQTGLHIQTGGGIRSMESVEALLAAGLSRLVLGTAAVRDPAFARAALAAYPDRIAIGIDARDGEAGVDGWTRGGGVDAVVLALRMRDLGARTLVYTDISRDGMLGGAALESTREMVERTGIAVIASGGIGSLRDIEDVRATGAAGVIVGKAIYEGKVDLGACLRNGSSPASM